MAQLLISLLGPVITYFATKLVDKLIDGEQVKAKDLKDRELMQNLRTAAVRAVRKVDLTLVQQLKAEGKWNESRKLEAKELALKSLKLAYGPDGMLNLSMFFNVNAEGLDNILGKLIETAIFNDRKVGQRSGSIKLK